MNHKEFWSLINEVNQKAESWNRDSILLTTQKKLLELPRKEIIDFHNYLKWYMDAADTPNLVAAAAAINDGTSDDRFIDFRAWLVSQGQEVYRKALKCADSLAELDIPQEDYYTEFEFYGYIGSYAYEVKTLLEQKSIQEIGTNEYFELKPKGRELVEHILEYHCAYTDPLANSKAPAIKSLYQLVKRQLSSYNVYDVAGAYPLSSQEKKEMKAELEFEQSPDRKHRWMYADLQEAVPELYGKYVGHTYRLGGM